MNNLFNQLLNVPIHSVTLCMSVSFIQPFNKNKEMLIISGMKQVTLIMSESLIN